MSMVTRMSPLVIMMMLKTISSHSVVLSKLPKVLNQIRKQRRLIN